jgi:methionyl-tRNA formyltransferase
MPSDKFFAIPGHVVALNKVNNSVMVACADGLLEVQEVERNGEAMAPTAFIKSIRVRFK